MVFAGRSNPLIFLALVGRLLILILPFMISLNCRSKFDIGVAPTAMPTATTIGDGSVAAPTGFVGTGTSSGFILNWDTATADVGYLLVRSAEAITWAPTTGTAYNLGDLDGGVTTAVYIGTDVAFTDSGLVNGATYYYGLFAYNGVNRYSTLVTLSGVPQRAWMEAYLKASNADAGDVFGKAVAIDSDTVVIGAPQEDSAQNSITNGTTASSDNSLSNSGAVYVFKRSGYKWVQEAYLKPPNSVSSFGNAVAISGDTIVVGAYLENSNSTAIINGAAASSNTSATAAGAAYVFKRSGSTWTQEAYLKAANAEAGDQFGMAVAISGDTIVVGANKEDSNDTTIINGTTGSADNSAADSGAVYVFKRTDSSWTEQAFIKPQNTDAGDLFGQAVGIDGDTIVVGALNESANDVVIVNGTTASADNSSSEAGAAYVFKRTGASWAEEAYLKPQNAGAGDHFGNSVSISSETIVIGAVDEDSNQTSTTNGTIASADNSLSQAGAAYVFKRTGTSWAEEAYLKSPNADASDQFGRSVGISADIIIVGADGESSNVTKILTRGTVSADNSTSHSGAAYLFERTGTNWAATAYLKAPAVDANDSFGYSVAISSGSTVMGAFQEDSNVTSITNGSTASEDNSSADSGAAYIMKIK